MISNVEQGLANYHAALLAYVRKSDKLKKKYGNEDWMTWGGDDYVYVQAADYQLKAMEHVLALSKAERKQVMREVKAQLANK